MKPLSATASKYQTNIFSPMNKEKHFQPKIDTEVGGMVLSGTAISNDDGMLIAMGYKPELKREFSFLSAFGQSWGSQGLAPSIAGSLIFALGSGGSVASISTWIVGCVLLIPAALALGEMSSSMPTSGGIYYWVAKLTPIKYRPLFCWFAAYMIILGYIMIYASTVYATTTMFLATISMSTSGTYVPDKYHEYVVYVGLCIITCAMTSFPSRILAKLNNFYVIYQGSLCLVLILVMSIATPSEYRNSVKFVFVDFQNTGYWTNNGWAWCLGLLTPVWVVSGFESSSTLAEEASNAATVVPFSMVTSLLASLVIGEGIIITLMFTMGTDILALLESQFKQPVGQMLYNALGKKSAVIVFFFMFLGFLFNCTNLAYAVSREIFAFSRDGGFPFSTHLRVLTKWKAPVRCVWSCAFISVITGLSMLANYTAISSAFNIGIIALYCSYIAPIISRLIWRDLKPGVFYLGKFSISNSIIAVLWMGFIVVLLFFPVHQKPDAEKMNYAIVVVGFVVIFCLGYYYFPKYGGKTFFQGPVRNIDSKQEIPVEFILTRR